MKLSTPVIVLIVLVVGIIVVVIVRAQQQSQQFKAQQMQLQQESALAMQYLNYANTQQQNEAGESTSVGDWLNTISSIGSTVGTIFSGMNTGDGSGGGGNAMPTGGSGQ